MPQFFIDLRRRGNGLRNFLPHQFAVAPPHPVNHGFKRAFANAEACGSFGVRKGSLLAGLKCFQHLVGPGFTRCRKFCAKPGQRLIGGAPIRGTRIALEMSENNFAGEGDMYVFATVLNEFFALYASINAFTELHVRGTKYGEVYEWPARLGQQTIL